MSSHLISFPPILFTFPSVKFFLSLLCPFCLSHQTSSGLSMPISYLRCFVEDSFFQLPLIHESRMWQGIISQTCVVLASLHSPEGFYVHVGMSTTQELCINLSLSVFLLTKTKKILESLFRSKFWTDFSQMFSRIKHSSSFSQKQLVETTLERGTLSLHGRFRTLTFSTPSLYHSSEENECTLTTCDGDKFNQASCVTLWQRASNGGPHLKIHQLARPSVLSCFDTSKVNLSLSVSPQSHISLNFPKDSGILDRRLTLL